MLRMLLAAAAPLAAIAAIALSAAPAGAQSAAGIGVPNAKPSVVSTPPSVDLGFRHFRGGRHRDGDRDHRRRHRGRDELLFAGPFYGDGDWDGGRAWEHDSYNDWWHERPHRAYPRWMRHNQDCERMWWSGGGWRC